MDKHRLAIVVPCYKEELVLHETTSRLTQVLDALVKDELVSANSYILYVNDGSTDNTWNIISELHESNKYVNGVNLAGNVGHQNALVAGLSSAVENCDMAISIDADLQDDVNAIREMVVKYYDGCDIVYGVRQSRKTDTWFKRTTALGFYSVMKSMGVKSVYNHADYRLMSQRALRQLLLYRERNLFLRGMVPTIGYKTDCVYYDRAERFAGESKYPLKKMISFAFDGITSFSVKPVHFVLYFGIIFLIIAFGIFCFVMYSLFMGHVVQGWTSLMLSIWFCSGSILLGLGIVGEYIGKIYVEVKDRPRFNIERILMHDK
ncbi:MULTISPECIES: glycosyltransferase family 2 protein [unclassified Bacteroides]|uniref:glycosyltransferase family 2 protein n=1 Tax=unclassified Bacteroides TaxID=2646097 RepID=UPI0004E0C7C6|nr:MULTISPECIES: glycosyltransferase family 2 protein [unclassified Bacteroides]